METETVSVSNKAILNIEAVKASVDELFTELVEDRENNEIFLYKGERLVNKAYLKKRVDTLNVAELRRLAKEKQSAFIKAFADTRLNLSDDEKLELFRDGATEKAKYYQTYFTCKTDKIHKSYYCELKRWIEAIDSLKPINSEATHRETILVHDYKVKVGRAESKTPAQWKSEVNAKRGQAAYSLIKSSTKWTAPTRKELTKVVELLKDFPDAQALALIDLARL